MQSCSWFRMLVSALQKSHASMHYSIYTRIHDGKLPPQCGSCPSVISLNDRRYYLLWMLMVAIGQHCTRHCHSRVWHLHARPHLAFPKLPSHPNCCPLQGCMCKQARVSSFHRAYVRHLLFSHNSMLRGSTGHMPRRDIQATTKTAPCSATKPAVQQSPDYRRATTTCKGEGGLQRGDVSRTKIRDTEE